MSTKLSIIIATDEDTVEEFSRTNVINKFDRMEVIPVSFKETVQEFMRLNIGDDSGFTFGLVKLNDSLVTLNGKDSLQGVYKVADLLPVSAGDILLEFSLTTENIVTIGVNRFLELKQLCEVIGPDDPVLLDELKNSLSIGINCDDENVFCFVSKLPREACVRYLIIDEDWSTSYKLLFRDLAKSNINTLDLF